MPRNRSEMMYEHVSASSICNASASSGWLLKSITVYAMSPLEVLICCEMFKPLLPRKVVISPSAPGSLRFTMHSRAPDEFFWGARMVVGKFTELRMVPVSRKSIIVVAAIAAEFSSASSVEAPRWGMTMCWGWPIKSGSEKSLMYFPVSVPLSYPLRTAAPSMISPLAKFKRCTLGLHFASASELIKWCVTPLMYGTCTVM
mmetsp:Transcript_4178/g.13944  ORF Transcript_4178/g.13944 Transcript_4178/m.13944 type:complete len:201 (-) Transcript_4178:979-1581(-)